MTVLWSTFELPSAKAATISGMLFHSAALYKSFSKEIILLYITHG